MFGVASIQDGIVAPVGFPSLVRQIIIELSISIIVTIIGTIAPWLITNRSMVVTTGSPAEPVAIRLGRITRLNVGFKVIPLVFGELPIRYGSTANVFKIAL